MDSIKKIALGGGCHWCTEAVFQSLEGVIKVDQGFVAQESAKSSFSEAVVVTYTSQAIRLKDLIQVHLQTHNSTSNHSMREKYRSAIYAFNQDDFELSVAIINELQTDFDDKLVTQVYYFRAFKPSAAQFQNYYRSNPQKPFCKRYIAPKLKFLSANFSQFT